MKKLMKVLAFTPIVMLGVAVATSLSYEVAIAVSLMMLLLSFVSLPTGTLNSVVSNPLIGAAKQKMGNAVFSTWKGINVLKTKPLSVANPKSDKQLMRRSAIAQVVLIARESLGVIQLGFKKLAIKQSAYNAFASYALKNAFDYDAPPVASLVPLNLFFSKGTIATTPITAVVSSVGGATSIVTYPDTLSGIGQSLNDIALLVAYNKTKQTVSALASTALRSDGTATLPIPPETAIGDNIDFFLGFYNPTSGQASDSVTNVTAAVA